MDNFSRGNSSIAGEITTLTAFISSVIVYTNLIWAMDIHGLIGEFGARPPISWIPMAIAYSPWLIVIGALKEFGASFMAFFVSRYAHAKPNFIDAIIGFGMLIGVPIFVLVLSVVVGVQSRAYIGELAVPLKPFVWGLFGRA